MKYAVRLFRRVLGHALLLVLLALQAHAVSFWPKYPPIGKPTDEPKAAIPYQCRVSKTFQFGDCSRTMYGTDLERHRCRYRTVTSDKTMEQLRRECDQQVIRKGLAEKGSWEIRYHAPIVGISPNEPCDAPDSKSWTNHYSIEFTYSKAAFEEAQCTALEDCLRYRPLKKRDFVLAQQWQHKLGCVQTNR